MYNAANNGPNKVLAFSSQHSVTLVFDWAKSQTNNLLGFAVKKHNPDNTIVWIEGLLPFEGTLNNPGSLIPSNLAPLQKMYWADYIVRAGNQYMYEIIPVYKKAGSGFSYQLDFSKSIQLPISTEADQVNMQHRVLFNRAVISSQAYARNFENEDPAKNEKALSWLARGLDKFLLDFLNDANANNKKVDIAAYHMTQQAVIEAIIPFGNRARVSLCWKKEEDQEKNAVAADKLRYHGVQVNEREQVSAISHNKFIVVKSKTGKAEKVLMGSANFTNGGISLQNNVYHIIDDKVLANLYLKTFDLLVNEDNAGLRKQNKKWMPGGLPGIQVNFSPHTKDDRIDLDEYVNLVNNATSSVFFATFRTTDYALIQAITKPVNKKVYTRGLVDNVYQQNEGEVLLYHEAYEKNPAVVAARNISASSNFMTEERNRSGFNPLVHHKFILIDADTQNPIIITGSANYSKNSSEKNDENTLIIRDKHVGRLYLSEFFRIYEHYRSRWFLERYGNQQAQLYLKKDNSWLNKYFKAGTESYKFFQKMKNISS